MLCLKSVDRIPLHGIYMRISTMGIKNKKTPERRMKVGLPGGDRTPDPQLRRLLLYPTELRTDIKISFYYLSKIFLV